MDLTDLDSQIACIERLLRVSRECQFADIVAQIESEIAGGILPTILFLIGLADGAERSAVAKRYRRVAGLIAGNRQD